MNFIFPQNYNLKSKFLGFIDYTTLFLNVIWALFILSIVYFFIPSMSAKVSIFIILVLPFFLFSIVGFNHEKISYVLKYLYLYIKRPKLYLFRKF